jgi:hypothetical protein
MSKTLTSVLRHLTLLALGSLTGCSTSTEEARAPHKIVQELPEPCTSVKCRENSTGRALHIRSVRSSARTRQVSATATSITSDACGRGVLTLGMGSNRWSNPWPECPLGGNAGFWNHAFRTWLGPGVSDLAGTTHSVRASPVRISSYHRLWTPTVPGWPHAPLSRVGEPW